MLIHKLDNIWYNNNNNNNNNNIWFLSFKQTGFCGVRLVMAGSR